MSLDSFYGGHAGLSFILQDSFASVADAIAACKRGTEYTQTWYGEYLIIDTENINDLDNGKIYRRGLNYTNSMGGLEYVAQIVGPSSGTPFFNINTLDEVQRIADLDYADDTVLRYPIEYKEDAEGHVIGYVMNDEKEGDPAVFPISTARDTSLVPGKTDTGSFNDEILMTWINVRTNDKDKDSYFYAGVQIPYLVSEYTSHMVSPYDSSGNLNENPMTATRTDDKSHPFFMSWDFGLPKGIKGDTLRNLRVITPTVGDTIYDPANITINGQTGEVTLGAAGYTGQQDDITNGRKILVYDLYWYDQELVPDPVMVYLGDFNKIDNITIADDGTVTIDYSHDNNTVFSRRIKWINSVTLSPDTGVFQVIYNNGDPAFTTTLDWIKEIVLDDDGTIHYIHTANNRDESYANKIKWVTSVDLNTANGVFTMNFNYGEPLTRVLDYVDDVDIDETDGTITIHKVNSGNQELDAKLKLITSASAAANGIVTFYTNTGEQFNVVKTENGEQDFQIKMIDNVRLQTRLADDKHIQIKYNTANEYANIGDPINYVQDMVVRDSDFHLLVLFNDPEHRVTDDDLDDNNKDAEGHTWVNNVIGSDGVNTGQTIYWRDYGTIKDQAGILIGKQITDEDLGGESNVLDYLNRVYPNGLTEGATKQKIIVYTPEDSDLREFYAFDYDAYEWFFLGTLSDSGMRDAKLIIQGGFTGADLENITTDGLAFKVINSTGLKTTPIPDYWSVDYNTWV